MACCYTEQSGSPLESPGIAASPELFESDTESQEKVERDKEIIAPTSITTDLSPQDLIRSTDEYLLDRVHKYLSGVPPPPKLTICRKDCSELLLRIYENHRFFWSEPMEEMENCAEENNKEVNRTKKTVTRRTRGTSRNLSQAFDQCDPLHASGGYNIRYQGDGISETVADGCRVEMETVHPLRYSSISEGEARVLKWPEACRHRFYGIHYNRNKAIEEFENLSVKLCERYVGAETQSTCNVWFTKQAPGSARKRALLAKREHGQSPGKRLNHLTRRRRTFSCANLQGLGIGDKKQFVLNVKKPHPRKGKSPRGSSKKKVVRRLTLDNLSPLKSKLDSSKRALFQSPTRDHAGPSKLHPIPNPQNIKRALFPTPNKCEDAKPENSRKRKCEEEHDGPRPKWAKSLSFDCTSELHSSNIVSWDTERHSSSSLIERGKAAFTQGKTELSDTHRKKLLWAVAEALRSKGIGMSHPQFKQYASSLARTIKKFMPDLENRNIPRKPGSTSDRMLKLAKHHVLFIVDARPAE